MKIQVLGNCCASCHTVFANVKQAAHEIDPTIEVEHVEDIMKILSFHVMQTPAVIVDGKVVSMGRHLSLSEAKELVLENKK